ncbi:hypothetical protein LIER_35873 [Lithospermum erythrorhizon]|uniref:Glucan endo-1,3-beta-D-glucosidase n=1 Tax=Lithospermum erythrorhizon TaxID=34254 RepID=A0AAV3NZ41_LITER
MEHTDIQVKVSETGWPSKGDTNEVGATPENAGLYQLERTYNLSIQEVIDLQMEWALNEHFDEDTTTVILPLLDLTNVIHTKYSAQ